MLASGPKPYSLVCISPVFYCDAFISHTFRSQSRKPRSPRQSWTSGFLHPSPLSFQRFVIRLQLSRIDESETGLVSGNSKAPELAGAFIDSIYRFDFSFIRRIRRIPAEL
jgi:hypothetical protein